MPLLDSMHHGKETTFSALTVPAALNANYPYSPTIFTSPDSSLPSSHFLVLLQLRHPPIVYMHELVVG